MGRILLVGRLAVRDLRRRRIEAALLLIAILAATTTLTLGLVVRDAASDPYQSTRAATKGPDVVAGTGPFADLADLEKLATASGVTEHSGPYPVIAGKLEASSRTSDVQVEGRDAPIATVDQPEVTQGSWVSDGGVVLEAAFANSLDVHVGGSVTLGSKSFKVVGVAVTAAMPPYPETSCIVSVGCFNGAIPKDRNLPPGLLHNPGLVWLTQADVRSLAPAQGSMSYVMNLKLADPDEAEAFVAANSGDHSGTMMPMQTWQSILADATELARDSQILLLIGAWLLGLLAVASLSVLVGGRMADQTRRVGLLKAVGGTPGLVAAVLLAEYLLVAVVAAAAGLAIGALTAPLLTERGPGRQRGHAVDDHVHGWFGDRRRPRGRGRGDRCSGRARRPLQHRQRTGRRGTPTPTHRLADRSLGTTSRPAASRPAGRRPPAATGHAGRGQHRGHCQRDLHPPGPQHLPQQTASHPRIQRSSGDGAAARASRLDGHTALPGGGQRHRHHLGDGARQPAFLRAGARPRRNPW